MIKISKGEKIRREKISKYWSGRAKTKEHIIRLSMSQKGHKKKNPKKHSKNCSIAQINKWKDKQYYKKQRATINLVFASNEYRELRSKLQKVKWKDKKYAAHFKEKRREIVLPLRDTLIEVKIQNFLSKLHIEFMTHKYISEITYGYQCDIFIPQQETEGVIIPQKTIIECDGCYWHGCPICNIKKKRTNKKDKIRTKELIEKGFKVLRLWEHEIKKMELNDFKERLLI